MYWTVNDAIPIGWRVVGGCREETDAHRFAADEPGPTQIRLLTTKEHEIPNDAPEFRPEHIFTSERWCVLIPEEADGS